MFLSLELYRLLCTCIAGFSDIFGPAYKRQGVVLCRKKVPCEKTVGPVFLAGICSHVALSLAVYYTISIGKGILDIIACVL